MVVGWIRISIGINADMPIWIQVGKNYPTKI
jgi:hypothetical protein